SRTARDLLWLNGNYVDTVSKTSSISANSNDSDECRDGSGPAGREDGCDPASDVCRRAAGRRANQPAALAGHGRARGEHSRAATLAGATGREYELQGSEIDQEYHDRYCDRSAGLCADTTCESQPGLGSEWYRDYQGRAGYRRDP